MNSRLATLHAAFLEMFSILLNAPLLISACQGEFNSSSILYLFLVARKDTAYHINSDRNIHLYTTLQFVCVCVCSVTQSCPILGKFIYIYIHTAYPCMYAEGKHSDTMLVETYLSFLLTISEEILRSIKDSDLAL